MSHLEEGYIEKKKILTSYALLSDSCSCTSRFSLVPLRCRLVISAIQPTRVIKAALAKHIPT